MHATLVRRRPAVITAAALTAIGLCAAIAVAAPLVTGGGTQLGMENRTETEQALTSSVDWVDVSPVAIGHVPVFVLPGTTRLINARFSAESNCDGPQFGLCRVRIVAVNTGTGAITELNPASGLDFAFDTDAFGAATDFSEGNAVERSYRLPAGNWSIRVQFAVNNPTSVFRLDDWHFAVESSL